MLWVYDHYRYFKFFIAWINFRRQNLTSTYVRFWRLKSIPALKLVTFPSSNNVNKIRPISATNKWNIPDAYKAGRLLTLDLLNCLFLFYVHKKLELLAQFLSANFQFIKQMGTFEIELFLLLASDKNMVGNLIETVYIPTPWIRKGVSATLWSWQMWRYDMAKSNVTLETKQPRPQREILTDNKIKKCK